MMGKAEFWASIIRDECKGPQVEEIEREKRKDWVTLYNYDTLWTVWTHLGK